MSLHVFFSRVARQTGASALEPTCNGSVCWRVLIVFELGGQEEVSRGEVICAHRAQGPSSSPANVVHAELGDRCRPALPTHTLAAMGYARNGVAAEIVPAEGLTRWSQHQLKSSNLFAKGARSAPWNVSSLPSLRLTHAEQSRTFIVQVTLATDDGWEPRQLVEN